MTVAVLATAGCPQTNEPLGNRGIAIGGGGGTATDVLVFAVQPSSVTVGNVITPAVQVQAHDTLGNVDTGFSGSIAMAIATNPVGGNLGGTTSVAAVNGVASFGDLTIDRSGTGYSLRATATGATGATGATSGTFDVIAAAGSAAAR